MVFYIYCLSLSLSALVMDTTLQSRFKRSNSSFPPRYVYLSDYWMGRIVTSNLVAATRYERWPRDFENKDMFDRRGNEVISLLSLGPGK